MGDRPEEGMSRPAADRQLRCQPRSQQASRKGSQPGSHSGSGPVVARGAWLLAPLLACGCAPMVDVLGVYFPGWLVSAVIGIVVSYGIVAWLGRRPGARGLADSGLLFVGLTVSIALAVWWVSFSGVWGEG